MISETNKPDWTPPGLPAPAPGEPDVETLISVARGIARGAPWRVVAESRDLDFEEIRKWPWKFPSLWKAYLQKAVRLQVQLQVGQSLAMLGAIQDSGPAEVSRRACETVLHYNTILELIEQKTSNHQDTKSTKNYETADERGLTPTDREVLDYRGQDDERTFLPRLPVLMPRGPNRTPRRPSGKRYALPTPEALAVLRRQLKDPDPRIAHRAARTTLMHDARIQYLEARFGEAAFAAPPDHHDIESDGEQLSGVSSQLSVREATSLALPENTSADMRQGSAKNEGARGVVNPDTGSADRPAPEPPVVQDTS